MINKDQLLERLDAIGQSLSKTEQTLLLLGLGSVGTELNRLDAYSDLDFFVITKPGFKDRFINDLDWLNHVCPLSYQFRNADVGWKIMFEDGIYGEFAVFEESELDHIPCHGGRIVWCEPGYVPQIATLDQPVSSNRPDSLDFPLNEAVTNLYVGLCRYARGEKMSARTFIESYAMGQVIATLHLHKAELPFDLDPYSNDRRVESRFPDFSVHLSEMLQGYDKIPQSALHILAYIESIYPVNTKLSQEIKSLALHLGATLL
ncbi:hypothetical protein J2T12_001329 [Paenibacillus anaericanus]|uniref:hypothetical protein n=1 Tax=Paenibacillus anaericanus TaxID=170367 RepID=UPI0027882790|nr:hypothetical protein [Paenibacillus anaericanus]MDQ0087923.1 hypothetical protein [Paenibacillus anaericanus]